MTPERASFVAGLQGSVQSLRDSLRRDSLAFRLFVAAAAWSLIALPLTGLAIQSLFRAQVERDFDARLRQIVTTLIAESYDLRSTVPHKPEDMVEPLFKRPLTGWYWQIKPVGDHNGPTIVSESLTTEVLRTPREKAVRPDAEGHMWADMLGPERKVLRVIEREVTIGHAEDARPYSFAVGGPREQMDTDVSEFRNMMVVALSILGLGLLAATIFQVQYGLRPLKRIEQGLAAIRTGEAHALQGDLPLEIKPLQYEINALIEHNTAIVERARTQVGNLAHALKTPLSVITNEARDVARAGTHDGGPFAAKVAEQSELMRVQINHYLERARAAARIGVIGGATEVAPVVAALARALTRIYDNKREGEPIRLVVDCPAGLRFQGERQDLEEMVGNLMDNACKWAKSEVAVGIVAHGEGAGARVHITVDDDGPGLSAEERAEVGQRGKRLDETVPGTGLGLSIVADLAGLYRGKLELDRAPTGGLRAMLDLPAI